MNPRDCTDYVQDIIAAIDDVVDFTLGLSFDRFEDDRKTVNAVIRSIEIIGEAAKHVSQEVRAQFPKVPWKRMAGMRDKVSHEYFGVDLEIVWQTVTQDLPALRPLMEEVKSLL